MYKEKCKKNPVLLVENKIDLIKNENNKEIYEKKVNDFNRFAKINKFNEGFICSVKDDINVDNIIDNLIDKIFENKNQ